MSSRSFSGDYRYPKGSAEFDRPMSRPSLSKTASPRVGLSWPEEDYLPRKSLSPLLYSSPDHGMRLSDSSPAERRRLVSELRSEVRKVALKSSPPRRYVPSGPNGRSNGSEFDFAPPKRTFESSIRDDRFRPTMPMDFDERMSRSASSSRRGVMSTEEAAEKELAELERSTENLRKLGADIRSSASAYVSQARLDYSFSSARSEPSGASREHYPSGHGTGEMPSAREAPSSFGRHPYGQNPASPAYFTASPSSFYASPQHPGFAQPAHQEAARHLYYQSSPTMANPSQQQHSGQTMPSPMYFQVPQPMMTAAPAYFIVQSPPMGAQGVYASPSMVYSSQPPQFSPMHASPAPPTPYQQNGSSVAETPVPVAEPSVAARTAEPQTHSTSAGLNKTSSQEPKEQPVVFSSAPEIVKVSETQQTVVPRVAQIEEKEPSASIGVTLGSVAVFESSGQTPSAEIPPAHVDLNELEEERKRRMKREFLARKQKDPSAMAMAGLASEAAGLVKSKTGETEEKPSVPAHTPRPVVIAPLIEPSTPAESASSEAATDKTNVLNNEDEERAVRMQRLVEQAEHLPVDNSMAVVPFGVFLKNQTSFNGSFDNDDLSSSFKSMRPPPIIGGSTPSTGRRRARSTETADSGKVASPPSLIPSPASRQPVMLQGYLMKTSGPKRPTQFRGTWQKRWFILSGRLLLYTAAHDSSHVKRMIDLNRVDVVTDNLPEADQAPTPHCIGLIEKRESRMLTICAESHADILKWYKAIVLNCALLCKNQLPQKALPPVNKTKVSERDLIRKELMQRYASQLPQPPAPEYGWFYPAWQKPKSYYDLLGIAPDATPGIIKKAYYRIAKDSHPDRSTRSMRNLEVKPIVNPEEFAGVALAYETLIDPQKRMEYDLAERVKEELRNGIECYYLETHWSDKDLEVEPRLRLIRKVTRKRITLFCDGEIRYLYWQPAPEPEPDSENPAPLLPLCPTQERCIEMRFVQQILYFRDGPVDFGPNGPPGYDNEVRFVIMGDRLHTGPLLIEMKDHQYCTEIVHGLRVARCEKSMLFQQKLDSLREKGIK